MMRVAAIIVVVTTFATALVEEGTYNLLLSDTLPGNLLPQFKFQLGAIEGGSLDVKLGGGPGDQNPYVPFDTAPDEIWDHASTDLRAPSMPYLLQDQWTCAREPTDVPTIVYENERLKLSITPQWGARIWSVYDKVLERDWTFANPAHQPANIGVLKAWSAGGIEFNWSPGIIGHSVFAESPAYVGLLDTERGPVLRAYEFDRRNQSVWQADIWLPGAPSEFSKTNTNEKKKQEAGTPSTTSSGAQNRKEAGGGMGSSSESSSEVDTAKVWIHPKITNTQQTCDLEGYWWTCVAVPAAPSTRVVTPANWNLETSSDHSVGAPWPAFSMGNDNASFVPGQTDNSFLEGIWSGDFFMGPLERGESPVNYIAFAEENGFVGFHGHPLNGTKFFTWGQSGAGRFMQDFLGGLSGPEPTDEDGGRRQGDYMELQVGPAFTQFQTFDLPRDTTLEWSEVFGAFQGNVTSLASPDYGDAVGEVEGWLDGSEGVNDTAFLNTDAWLASIADTPLDSVLAYGAPWGAVEEIRREAAAAAAPFTTAASKKAAEKAEAAAAARGGLRRGARSPSSSAQLSPGLTFDHDAAWASPEARPWAELATSGGFSADTLASQPLSYQVGDEWLELLLASEGKAKAASTTSGSAAAAAAAPVAASVAALRGAGDGSGTTAVATARTPATDGGGTATDGEGTWLHDLHIAIALVERGEVEEPLKRFASSLAKNPSSNPIACRNLAVLLSTPAEAWPFYEKAFAMALQLATSSSNSTATPASSTASESGGNDDDDNGSSSDGVAAVNKEAGLRLLVNLGSEMCALLQGASMWDELKSFIEGASFSSAVSANPVLATLDTVLLSQVFVQLRTSPADPEGALSVLGAEGKAGCFPTFGKVRSVLMDLWFEAQQQIEEAELGRGLLPIEARDNRVAFPVPRNIGCPYASWSGANKCTYW